MSVSFRTLTRQAFSRFRSALSKFYCFRRTQYSGSLLNSISKEVDQNPWIDSMPFALSPKSLGISRVSDLWIKFAPIRIHGKFLKKLIYLTSVKMNYLEPIVEIRRTIRFVLSNCRLCTPKTEVAPPYRNVPWPENSLCKQNFAQTKRPLAVCGIQRTDCEYETVVQSCASSQSYFPPLVRLYGPRPLMSISSRFDADSFESTSRIHSGENKWRRMQMITAARRDAQHAGSWRAMKQLQCGTRGTIWSGRQGRETDRNHNFFRCAIEDWSITPCDEDKPQLDSQTAFPISLKVRVEPIFEPILIAGLWITIIDFQHYPSKFLRLRHQIIHICNMKP
jgi:hypothetical protein